MTAFGPEDDALHPPTSDDPWWSETYWFGFDVPERRLSCTLYPWLRPNLGISAAGIAIWDDTADLPWEMLLWDWQWQLPMPEGEMPNVRFGNGASYECLEPMSAYRVRYRSPDTVERPVALDVTWRGIGEAYDPFGGPAAPGTGHFDQLGRAEGWLRIDAETFTVDCFTIRDRSWGARPDLGDGVGSAAYTWAVVSEQEAFHAVWAGAEPGAPLVGGILVRDGVRGTVTSGRRHVERDDGLGAPASFVVELGDDRGRLLRAEGRGLNHGPFHPRSNMFAWVCLVEWSFDGGTTCFGQDQDIWAYSRWRDRARAGRASRTGAPGGDR